MWITVGSRTGARTLGSGGLSTTFAVGLSPAPIATFPAPASSNRACRFPAHGSPARFAPRVMRPIELETLSAVAHNLGVYSCHRDPIPHRATAYSTSSSQSAFALTYILRLRYCKLMGDFIISPLPPILTEASRSSRVPSLYGHYPASSLLRTHPPPSRLRPISPLSRDYTAYLAPPISRRDEEGFSSCSTRPCHRAVTITPPE